MTKKNKKKTTEMQNNNNTPNIPQLAQAATAAHFQTMMPQGFPPMNPNSPPYNYFMGHSEEPPWVKRLFERLSHLETEFKKKFEQLENSVSFISNEFDSLKSNMKTLEQENSSLKKDLTILKESIIDNKCHSMRNNLVLHGVAESKDEKCEDTIRHFIKEKLNIDTSHIDIERAHRIGPYRQGKSRPIVTKFLKYKQKEAIKKESYKLKGTKFGLGDQYPKEIVSRRAILRPIEKQERSEGRPAYLSVDKLYTTGWCYYVDDGGTVQRKASRRPVHNQHPQRPEHQPAMSNPLTPNVSDALTGAHHVLHASDNTFT